MNIAVNVETGISPLEVIFSVVNTMVNIVKWTWLFGDGSQSTEPAPRHTYMAPGVYTVQCTVVDEFGNSYTLIKPDYIYVYDFAVGPDGLLSGTTDFCFKHAVKTLQGQGITPVSGRWVWPPLIAATAKGTNENHENISLVINSDTMEIFQIGIPELWTDRAGGYDEAEIECEAFFPEITARRGEHENVRHIETHVPMRSWDEKNYRGKAGYTSDGFRVGHELSLEIFEGGEQIVPTTKLMKVEREGDYAFLKEVEATRMQIKLKYSTSAFRTTKCETHCQEIDHRTPPQLNYYPEKVYQKEFSSPDIWFSRNKTSMQMNRADGTLWTGAGTTAAGPDGKSASAFNSTGLSGVVAYTIADFTISGWMMGDGVLFFGHVQGGVSVTVDVIADTVRFTDGIDTVNFPMTPSVAWRHLAVVRSGSTILIYENGRLRISQPLTGLLAYGGNCTVGNGTVFDIRRYSRAISGDALYYYYDGILKDEGGFLP